MSTKTLLGRRQDISLRLLTLKVKTGLLSADRLVFKKMRELMAQNERERVLEQHWLSEVDGE